MKEHWTEFSIEKMADILGACCSRYYDFLKREADKRTLENQRLTEEIKETH